MITHFILLLAKTDRDIDILNSKDETFNASIKRSIEPGLITVFDKEIKNIGGRDIM